MQRLNRCFLKLPKVGIVVTNSLYYNFIIHLLFNWFSKNERIGVTVGFFKSFNKALNDKQTPFEVNGIAVTCSHCGGVSFDKSKAQLNTAGLSFLDLDWANRSATVLICDTCGKIEWFLADVEEK